MNRSVDHQAELLIEVNAPAFHFCTFDHSELLFFDKRKHFANRLFGDKRHSIYTGRVGNFKKHKKNRLLN